MIAATGGWGTLWTGPLHPRSGCLVPLVGRAGAGFGGRRVGEGWPLRWCGVRKDLDPGPNPVSALIATTDDGGAPSDGMP